MNSKENVGTMATGTDNVHDSADALRLGKSVDAPVGQSPQIPIACSLSGDDLAWRQGTVESLFDQASQVRELANGYAYEYPPTREWADKLAEFVLEERECCPFFTFEMVFEANMGSLWLRLGGSDDIKEFMKAGRTQTR